MQPTGQSSLAKRPGWRPDIVQRLRSHLCQAEPQGEGKKAEEDRVILSAVSGGISLGVIPARHLAFPVHCWTVIITGPALSAYFSFVYGLGVRVSYPIGGGICVYYWLSGVHNTSVTYSRAYTRITRNIPCSSEPKEH